MIAQATYRMLGGALGLSDEMWSLIVQLVAFPVAGWAGWQKWPKATPVASLVALGVLIDIFAQIVIAGGGPGACVGFVILPLYYLLAGWIGNRLAKRWKRLP